MQTPVVLIIYRRPDTTRQVLKQIRRAKPDHLFIIADGPKNDSDKERCQATRAVVENVDWPCKIHRNYADDNEGLRNRVISGLNWVFEHVDRAIILEDDCVPDPVFFPFCDELLDRYEETSSIMTISGNNFQPTRRTASSYYFSRYMHCWGWATWKRAWSKMDPDMSSWPRVKEQQWLCQLFPTASGSRYWNTIFERVFNRDVDSWAYVWQYCIWMSGGVNILPEVNLVSNIGHDDLATHTTGPGASPVRAGDTLSQPFRHPLCIIRHRAADAYTQSHHYERSRLGTLISRGRRLLSRLSH